MESIMDSIRQIGRDNARTPMQWTAGNQAGFSSAEKTWSPVHPNHVDINVEAALANPDSIFYTYQKLVALRKEEDWLIDGDFELLETADKVFAYRRSTEEKVICCVNLSDLAQPLSLSFPARRPSSAIPKCQGSDSKTLQAWDAFCIALN